MFLEDELEYTRLKRNDNIMGWLAIVFVAALVFMFAGIMNSASATGSSPASIHHAAPAITEQARPDLFGTQASVAAGHAMIVAFEVQKAAPSVKDAGHASEIASAGTHVAARSFSTAAPDEAEVAHPVALTLADRDIQSGVLLISFALMGASFVMLTFGGPRGGKREDEDAIDAL
ncbi:hypothetical protein [Rhizobium sp. C4]|uniref:hypothetical protein n=1 Tax=Rhizobium sp. C4 TaxID=1349800 RepID=UPI001E374FE7|nr:hypothetical protein [Rhizobium sp. C4]MCD2173686.1 hypothetical protein [Rhizobium sp. C4]